MSASNDLALWMLLGLIGGLSLSSLTSIRRFNREMRQMKEVQQRTLDALRSAQMIIRHQCHHSADQVEFDQKVVDLERLFNE